MHNGPPRIAIITDDPGWHGRQLLRHFELRGCHAEYLRLQECGFNLGNPSGLDLGPFGDALPDGVFVRGVPGGSLEQVIVRLDILHAMKQQQVPVYNDGRAIERTVDKAMTSFLLHRAAIPTPPTWVLEDTASAHAVIAREWALGHEVVCKPLFGSQGEGLRKLAPGAPLPDLAEFAGVAYLQRFVPGTAGVSRDFRVFVIGGKVDCAMTRFGQDWINNVAQGARCEAVQAIGELEFLAVAATRVLEMDYAGVDIISTEDGRLQVLEVNRVPAWYGLQSVTPHRIAARLVDDFLDRCVLPARAARTAPVWRASAGLTH